MCKAICAADARVEGSITCVSGLLVGVSYCLSSDDMIADNVTKVVGELELEVASSVTVDQLTAAIAKAFAVDPQHVLVFVESGSKRRLADAVRRFLSSSFLVEYEVAVPASSDKDQFFNAAKTIADQASAAGKAFTSMLETLGVKVFNVDVVQEAVLADAVVIRDNERKIVKFNEPPEASASAWEGSASGLTREELLGVVLSVISALILIIWIVRMLHCSNEDYLAVLCCCCLAAMRLHRCCKKESKSPEANGMSHSLSENRH